MTLPKFSTLNKILDCYQRGWLKGSQDLLNFSWYYISRSVIFSPVYFLRVQFIGPSLLVKNNNGPQIYVVRWTEKPISLSKFYLPSCSQVMSSLLNKPGSFCHTPVAAVDMMLSTPAKQAKERGLRRGMPWTKFSSTRITEEIKRWQYSMKGRFGCFWQYCYANKRWNTFIFTIESLKDNWPCFTPISAYSWSSQEMEAL